MAIYRLQGKAEKRSGIYYEFDPSEEPLGEGGMGKVYKGRCVNEVTGTAFDVAIKFMFSDLPAHAIERARREASIQIRHDNLVEMLGFIDIEEKGPLGDIQHHYHVVSELLDGIMLDDLLAGKLTNKRGEPMPFAQKLYNDYQRDPYHFATYIIRNVLSGLMALHDAGYIHRDIDPTNIMITSNGHIKLIDFGIAKQMQSLTTNDKSLTVAGVFMGKPEYAAPELILGDIKSQDKTTDIYAVGILLFQCIIGHPPFEGDRHEVMNKQLHQKMPLGLIKKDGNRQDACQAFQECSGIPCGPGPDSTERHGRWFRVETPLYIYNRWRSCLWHHRRWCSSCYHIPVGRKGTGYRRKAVCLCSRRGKGYGG